MGSRSVEQVTRDEDTNTVEGIVPQFCLPMCSGYLTPASVLGTSWLCELPALWSPQAHRLGS